MDYFNYDNTSVVRKPGADQGNFILPHSQYAQH